MKNLLWWVVFTIGAVLWVDISLAEPQWAQKPIQCASYEEVVMRAKADNLKPLMTMEGNALIEDKMYTLPYIFYYNADTSYWLIVELLAGNIACIIAVGDTVDFDMSEWEEPSYKRNW